MWNRYRLVFYIEKKLRSYYTGTCYLYNLCLSSPFSCSGSLVIVGGEQLGCRSRPGLKGVEIEDIASEKMSIWDETISPVSCWAHCCECLSIPDWRGIRIMKIHFGIKFFDSQKIIQMISNCILFDSFFLHLITPYIW